MRWQPGFYTAEHINPQTGSGHETFDQILEICKRRLADQPKLTGVKLTIPWGLIEKERGVFDWSGMDRFINGIPDGKYIQLELKDRLFGNAWYWAKGAWFPKYLCTDSTQQYLYTDVVNRIMPRLDSEEYYQIYINVLREMGKRYASNPKIVAVRYMNETAQAAPSNKLRDAYTGEMLPAQYHVNSNAFRDAYRKNINRLYNDIKDYWKEVCLCGSWNFYPGTFAQHKEALDIVKSQPRNAMNFPDSPVGMGNMSVRVRGTLSKPLRNIDRDLKWDFVVSVDGQDYTEHTQYAHQIDFTVPPRFIPFYYEKGWNNNFFKENDIIINCDDWSGRVYKVGAKVVFDSGAVLTITELVNPPSWSAPGNAGTYDQLWVLDNKENTIMLLNEDATNLSSALGQTNLADWDQKSNLALDIPKLKRTYIYRIMDLLINVMGANMITIPTGAGAGADIGSGYANFSRYVLYPALDQLGRKVRTAPPKNILG